MKTSTSLLFCLLLFTVLGFSACGDDDTTDSLTEETLNYDGPNLRAPINGEGITTFGAFFPASEVSSVTGRQLARVDFWLQTIPDATSVAIYTPGTNDRSPGQEIYRIDLTQRIRNTGWYEHVIPADWVIEIPAEGLWLTVETTLPANGVQAIGCDAGTNYSPNGDRIRPAGGGNIWTSFNEITGSETVNWNIRGVLASE